MTDAGADRLRGLFETVRSEDRAALLPYLTVGIPDIDSSVAMFEAMSEAGADGFEIGIPYADPLMDGPVIAEAAERSLAAGMTIARALEITEGVVASTGKPVLLMTYTNPVLYYGIESFARAAADVGAAGLIIADLPIEAIHASPLRRAMQTAQCIANELNLEIQFDSRLKEVHAGDFQDQIRSEIMRRFPDAIPRWRSGDLDFAFPGGESRRELIQRGHEALHAVIDAGYEQVAVVSHGGLLLAAMKAMLGIPSETRPLDMKNASITRLSIDVTGCVELLDFDNVEHLAGLESPQDQ